jgi:hypothetical protein
MKSTVIRTAVASSVITAVLVSALGLWAVPKIVHPASAQAQEQDGGMQPAVYNGAQTSDRPVLNERPRAPRPSAAVYRDTQPSYPNQPGYSSPPAYTNDQSARDPYGEPVRRHRSTDQSALIVAGSAGTGAAIGALAGGGKGAAIGAISGGAAGFIYDRMTANK